MILLFRVKSSTNGNILKEQLTYVYLLKRFLETNRIFHIFATIFDFLEHLTMVNDYLFERILDCNPSKVQFLLQRIFF